MGENIAADCHSSEEMEAEKTFSIFNGCFYVHISPYKLSAMTSMQQKRIFSSDHFRLDQNFFSYLAWRMVIHNLHGALRQLGVKGIILLQENHWPCKLWQKLLLQQGSYWWSLKQENTVLAFFWKMYTKSNGKNGIFMTAGFLNFILKIFRQAQVKNR